jgi:hypothetical protein
MSADTGRSYDPARNNGWGGRRCGHGEPWKPVEILAMVLGFIVFWPIGLAILGWKFWQKRSGYRGDIVSFGKEKWEAMVDKTRGDRNWPYGSHHWGSSPRHGYSARSAMDQSGNYAFDEWRSAELERLQEEYRKIVAAEKEFAEFMETLRRARDRDEFERFMNERRNRPDQQNQ